MDIFEQIRKKTSELADKTTSKIKNRLESKKKENAYYEQMEKDNGDWVSLMMDHRYPVGKKFLEDLKAQLQGNLNNVLMANMPNFSKEEIVYKSAIITGQINLLDYLINEPERVIEMLKDKK